MMSAVGRAYLLADLPADGIFLLVERLLLLGGDMRVVPASHIALFGADLVILGVQGGPLVLADLTVLHLSVDALVLVVEPAIDLRTTRVFRLPFRPRCQYGTRRRRSVGATRLRGRPLIMYARAGLGQSTIATAVNEDALLPLMPSISSAPPQDSIERGLTAWATPGIALMSLADIPSAVGVWPLTSIGLLLPPALLITVLLFGGER